MKFHITTNIGTIPPFPPQNPFQTQQYLNLYTGSRHAKAYIAAVLSDDNQLILAQPITTHHYITFLPPCLGTYIIANYQPYQNPDYTPENHIQAFSLMQQHLHTHFRRKALYIEYRHYQHNNIYHNTLLRHRYTPVPWYNCKIRLTPTDSLINHLHTTKRNELRHTLNSNALITTTPTQQQWQQFYHIIRRFYRKIHRPLPEYTIFENARLSPIATTALVTIDSRVVAGGIMLKNNNIGNTWYYCSQPLANNINPTLLIIRQFVQTLTANSTTHATLDLMGAGHRHKPSGIRQFKLSLGSQLIPEYRYRKTLLL